MPVIVWAGAGLLALLGVGWSANKVGDAMDSTTGLAKWVVIGGAVYLVYQGVKIAKVAK